jgi:hypothetical protein
MILLQAASPVPSFGIFETLTQYGALGVITLGLGAALWFMLKRQIATEDSLKARVESLQKELNDYIRGDAASMKNTIDNNAKALQDLKDFIMYNKGGKK